MAMILYTINFIYYYLIAIFFVLVGTFFVKYYILVLLNIELMLCSCMILLNLLATVYCIIECQILALCLLVISACATAIGLGLLINLEKYLVNK